MDQPSDADSDAPWTTLVADCADLSRQLLVLRAAVPGAPQRGHDP